MYIMGIIRRSYSTDFYDWPISKERKHVSALKWESEKGQPIVVYHPFLTFDPISKFENQRDMLDRDLSIFDWQETEYHQLRREYMPHEQNITPIVHEKIMANYNFFDCLELLLTAIEKNFKVPDDTWLWYDTGYWTAWDAKYSYIGLSEKSALDLWTKTVNLTLCYVVSSPSMLLEFKLNKSEENSFYLNIYYTNKFIVFPDLIDAVHKSLEGIGKWKLLKTEKVDHDTIFEVQNSHQRLINELPNKIFPIMPARVIPLFEHPQPGTDFLFAVAVENTFFKIENKMKEPEGFAIMTRSGGWLREDFQFEKSYQVIFDEVIKLENCYVVWLAVDELKEDNSNYKYLLENFLNKPDPY